MPIYKYNNHLRSENVGAAAEDAAGRVASAVKDGAESATKAALDGAKGVVLAAKDRVSLGGVEVSPLGVGAWSWGDTMFWGYSESMDKELQEVGYVGKPRENCICLCMCTAQHERAGGGGARQSCCGEHARYTHLSSPVVRGSGQRQEECGGRSLQASLIPPTPSSPLTKPPHTRCSATASAVG